MKKNNKILITDLYNKIADIGVDLSIIASIIKFLDVSYSDSNNFSKSDIHNLIITLKKMINSIRIDYSEIEKSFDL